MNKDHVMKFSQSSFQKAGVSVVTRVANELHSLNYNKQASSAMRAVEAQRGPTDPRLVRLSNEYAREVLGSAKYAPWLRVYSAMNGRFSEGWVPDNYYGLVVTPLKNGPLGKATGMKTLTNRILNTEAMPDIAYLIDGVFYDRDFMPLSCAALHDILFLGDERVFFKTNGGSQGRGLWIFRKQDFRLEDMNSFSDGVFQTPIKQHEFFAEISPHATATLRITTVINTVGVAQTRAAYLRVGRATDEFVRSASHVRIPVNRETGAFSDFCYMHDWRRTDKHPDSGFEFSGKTIPLFRKATVLCEALHQSCPQLTCVGWDVCIDFGDAVKLMEWNAGHNDIKFSEATTGPCFKGLGWEDLWKPRA